MGAVLVYATVLLSIERDRRGREEDYPAFLLVEEAAEVLRIGRGKAYAMARRYRETNGAEGLPVIDLGHALRVPVDLFEAWFGPLPGWFLAKRCAALRAKQEAADAKQRGRLPSARRRDGTDGPDEAAQAGRTCKAGQAHPKGVQPAVPRRAPKGNRRRRPPSGQLSLLDGWSGADDPEGP